ncbi:response regulator [Tranquillimonas rosea]|uniref:response regulator n=1 Tax=Tranquillimonas rosea TaxID=641238 RepID=UPI003BAA638B
MQSVQAEFMRPRPTAERPLLGQTIMVVEDSHVASETLRLMCLRSGARIRRADSLKSAGRHLCTYRPSIAIVDMGLPDGSGADLITSLAGARHRVQVLLATSGDPASLEEAQEAGADGTLAKPLSKLATFQAEILSRLSESEQPSGPRPLPMEEIVPDPAALRDDFAHLQVLLAAPNASGTTRYAAGFALGVAQSCGDAEMVAAAEALLRACHDGLPLVPPREALLDAVRTHLDPAPA